MKWAFQREREPWGAKQCSPRKENISELKEVQGSQPKRDKHSGLKLERQNGITEGPEVCTLFQKSSRNTRSLL